MRALCRGARRIELSTATLMTGLMRLYAHHGYRVVGTGPAPKGLDAHERSRLALDLGTDAGPAQTQS